MVNICTRDDSDAVKRMYWATSLREGRLDLKPYWFRYQDLWKELDDCYHYWGVSPRGWKK